MPFAPNRGLRLGLRTLFVVVTVSACVVWWTRKDPEEFICIAVFGDGGTVKATLALLTAKGIENGAEGSITYSIYVRRHDAPRACELVRGAAPKLGPFQNWIADY